MKKIAIVGTSRIRKHQEEVIYDVIEQIFESINDKFMVISGGATGVDTIAMNAAKKNGIETMVYNPKKRTWEYFKRRNLKMAIECDELYCLSVPVWTEKCYHHDTPQDHQKTAGCWTLNKAKELGKKCRFYRI